jgi:Outer membrane protein beta-barrel domain
MSGIFLAGIRDDDQSRRSSSPERSVSRILKGTGMPNNKFAVTLCVLLLLTLALHGSVSAQSEERKLELGVQLSGLQGNGFGDRDTVGGGGRVTYNLTKHIALEGELNYLTSGSSNDYNRLQGQFGVKAGQRFKRFGVFGKVRPGFINTKQDFFFQIPCGTICTQAISATDSHTGFSLDVGGVAEIYPSKRILVRFDVGDTIANGREPIVFIDSPIFSGQLSPIVFGRSLLAIPGRTVATHNLQLSAGVGFRF